MYVKTKLLPSAIHGLGVFADQPIRKGGVIWRFTPTFDQKLAPHQILELPKAAQIYLATYAYLSEKTRLYILPADNGRYFNHSTYPNARSEYEPTEEEVVTRAIRDIRLGEEITDDYSSFEDAENTDNILTNLVARYRLTDEIDPRLKIKRLPAPSSSAEHQRFGA